MAIAERRLAAEFNRPGHAIVDHRTYVIGSDGDLQEGVASEAASLAGHLRLGKLVVLYDDNHIQLDGPTSMAWSEDVPRALRRLRLAHPAGRGRQRHRRHRGRHRAGTRPTTARASIAVRTHIGFGSPNKQDSQKAHGSPLGPDEVRLTKEAYGWDPDRTFYVPGRGRATHFRAAIPAGEELVADWERALDALRGGVPGRSAAEFRRRIAGAAARRLGRGPDDLRDRHRGRHPQRQPGRDPRPRGRGCPSCSAAPRTSPSRT